MEMIFQVFKLTVAMLGIIRVSEATEDGRNYQSSLISPTSTSQETTSYFNIVNTTGDLSTARAEESNMGETTQSEESSGSAALTTTAYQTLWVNFAPLATKGWTEIVTSRTGRATTGQANDETSQEISSNADPSSTTDDATTVPTEASSHERYRNNPAAIVGAFVGGAAIGVLLIKGVKYGMKRYQPKTTESAISVAARKSRKISSKKSLKIANSYKAYEEATYQTYDIVTDSEVAKAQTLPRVTVQATRL